MDRSPGFGSTPSNLIAHLRLAFATAPHLKCLTLLLNVTRWPVLQKVRGHTSNVLPQLVSAGFQVLFHSPPGVLFTFPSRYCFAIGHWVVFRLGGWAPRLHTKFLVLGATLVPSRCMLYFVYGTFTLCGVSFQTSSTIDHMSFLMVLNPE